jgi:hypothetical protein
MRISLVWIALIEIMFVSPSVGQTLQDTMSARVDQLVDQIVTPSAVATEKKMAQQASSDVQSELAINRRSWLRRKQTKLRCPK